MGNPHTLVSRDAMAMTGIIKNGHAQLDQRLM
jgi:hypothetical protein